MYPICLGERELYDQPVSGHSLEVLGVFFKAPFSC